MLRLRNNVAPSPRRSAFRPLLAPECGSRAVGKKSPRSSTATDTPGFLDNNFPDGKSTLVWEFRTAAFSAEGEDQGTYYAYGDWTYTKVKGKPAVSAVVGTKSGDPGSAFKSAVDLFCASTGFVLPGPGTK